MVMIQPGSKSDAAPATAGSAGPVFVPRRKPSAFARSLIADAVQPASGAPHHAEEGEAARRTAA